MSRAVRTFGTEDKEVGRYKSFLALLRRISIRQTTAYLIYLVTNASLFNLTKVHSLWSFPIHLWSLEPQILLCADQAVGCPWCK